MSQRLMKMGKYLSAEAEPLANEVVEKVIDSLNLDLPQFEVEKAITMYIDLFEFLGHSLEDEDADELPEALLKWSKENARSQVSSRGRISEIAIRYTPTREVFADLITRLGKRFDLSIEENTYCIKRLNRLMDVSLNETVFAFEELTDRFRENALKEMAELSAPIVPVKEGIAVIPLIGTFDHYRIAYLKERVVPRIAEQQIEHLIIDYSGILKIEEEFAYSLSQLVSILHLLDVKVIVTGVSPKLAQFTVMKGINMSGTRTFATVKQALDAL